MSILICPECGAENPSTAKRCHQCNALLSEVPLEDLLAGHDSQGDPLDMLSETGDDLPDLLNALKNEEHIQPEELEQGSITPESDGEPLSGVDAEETEPEEVIPDWLQRIRQRANEEADARGEITQKIIAAQDHLDEEKQSGQQAEFGDWLEGLSKDGRVDAEAEQTEEDQTGEENLTTSDADSDWLARIRKAQGKVEDVVQDSSPETRDGDSLLQWLVALEDGTDEPQFPPQEEMVDTPELNETAQEPSVPVADLKTGDTKEIRIGGQEQPALPRLAVSREEQLQADQLTATIVDESAARPLREAGRAPASWVLRLVLSIIIIAGLGISLFAGRPVTRSELDLQPQHQALISWVEGLPEGAVVLIVFDYQAGFADEISLVAQPILETVIQPGRSFSILASTTSGLLLADQLLNEMMTDPQVIREDLGYFPSALYAAYGMAAPSQADWRFIGQPELNLAVKDGDFDGVLILSSTFEGAAVWIEQFSARMPATPLNCLVTAQAGPLLLPYWESGQIAGLVSGLSEARAMEAALGAGTVVASRWRAYQFGVLSMIVLIVLGATFVDSGARDKKGGKTNE